MGDSKFFCIVVSFSSVSGFENQNALRTCDVLITIPGMHLLGKDNPGGRSELKISCFIQVGVGYCDPNPCENGAECLNFNHDYFCSCSSLFTGKNCSILRNPCREGSCEGATQFFLTLKLSYFQILSIWFQNRCKCCRYYDQLQNKLNSC